MPFGDPIGTMQTAGLAAPVPLFQYTGQTVLGNAVFTSPMTITDQLGYEMQVSSRNTGVVTNPFYRVTLNFYDDLAGTLLVKSVGGTIAVGSNAHLNVSCTGPMRGRYLQVVVTNLDTNILLTFNLNLSGTSRLYQRDDWRENPLANGSLTNVSGFTRPSTDMSINLVAFVNATVAQGATTSRLLPLCAGRVAIRIFSPTNITANQLEFELFEQNNAIGDLIDFFAGGSALGTYLEFVFPRDHMIAKFSNNGTGGAAVMRLNAILADY